MQDIMSFDCRSLMWGSFILSQMLNVSLVMALGIDSFPNCFVDRPGFIGDGSCDGGIYNTVDCGYDGEDCFEFNRLYPDCDVEDPFYVGDGFCHGGKYNTLECGYDGNDCIEFNALYPRCSADEPWRIGNFICDGDGYNTVACGFDGNDCGTFETFYPSCTVEHPEYIGNGLCDLGDYNTEVCGFDGGDCDAYNGFLLLYPSCFSASGNFSFVGDGTCNREFVFANPDECELKENDCIGFNIEYPRCKVDFPFLLGNGKCDGGPYNTEDCNWDGLDCFLEQYPSCHVDISQFLGDSLCQAFGNYNTEECNYDAGDCEDFNARYPDCKVDLPYQVGNRVCNGGAYNTPQCGYDGGDCKYSGCKRYSLHSVMFLLVFSIISSI